VPKFDKNKGVLLISNHTSFIDSFIISASCNKELVFVFPEKFKRKWYVSCFMNIFEVIETENFEYQENELMEIENALKQKKIVCMFPEKAITYSGQMGEFHNEADVILKNMGDSINVYAISLKGLFGSYFSRASNRIKRSKNTIIKRRPVYVAFGNKTLPENTSVVKLKQEIVKNINVDDVNVVAVNVDDERSGEKIVLLFKGDVSEDFVIKAISDSNISFISRPKHYFKVDEIPLLGSGKLDFSSSKKLTLEKLK
jgi:1-acyl-sn-glycerol-3-phosphate acyltransferase